MIRNQNSGDGARKLRVTMLVVSLAAVSIAVGAAYSLGIFNQAEPETREPLRITLSSDRLDFGDLILNDIATRQLILRNDGEKPLTAELLVNDSNLRVSPAQLILHPGVGSRVVVELVGNRAGSLEDQLRVVIDDADSEPLVVALAGRVWRDAAERPLPASKETPRVLAERREAQPGYTAENEFQPERRLPAQVEVAEATPERSGALVAANAQASAGKPDPTPAGESASAVSSSSRRPTASGGSNPPQAGNSDASGRRSKSLVRVTEYDPRTSAPIRSLAERPPLIPTTISDEEKASASEIPRKTATGEDGADLPEQLPEEPVQDDDVSRDRDLNQREDDDDDDPFVSPKLTISGQSTVRVLGGSAQFYPQEITIVGTDMGGPIGLLGAIEFPVVPLAFGESMLFAQNGAALGGGFDPMTGTVQFVLNILAVDSDGDAASMDMELTTGTIWERNESGNPVAITGTPRDPGSGLLRLVGIEKIPGDARNGGEQHLVVVEILASLTFGTSISSSNPEPISRIGG